MFITTKVVNMVLNKHFILASSSASRYRLLKNTGLSFARAAPECDEDEVKKRLLKKKHNQKKPSKKSSQRKGPKHK